MRGSEFKHSPYFCSELTPDSLCGVGGLGGLCVLQHRKRTGVPWHLLLAPTAPASPSTAHAMLSVFPGVCTALCRAGIQLMFPERAEGGEGRWTFGLWAEFGSLIPTVPSPGCHQPHCSLLLSSCRNLHLSQEKWGVI